MKAVAALSVLGAANATNLALTWNDCGGLAKIAEVVPATVPLGTATTITGSGNSPTKVSGGNFAATVKAGWIPLASCSGPLGPAKTCTLPLGAGSLTLDAIALPIGPGAASIGLTVDLAASLPAQLATTTTHATATNEAGQKMVCIDVFLKSGAALSNPVGGVFDEILKLVCQLMENGSTEPEAEKLICSSLKYELEVAACDKVVDLLWKGFENKECPAHSPAVVTTALSRHYGGVFDDILKLVCKLMENGSTEAEAEKLICSSLKYEVEVKACDKVVDLLWKKFEGKECPAGSHASSVVV